MDIDVETYKQMRDEGVPHVLIDVREEHETDISLIDDSILIPMDELESKLDSMDPEQLYVVYCRVGNRSQTAVEIMERNGFKNVKNLLGGINEWAEKIDMTLPIY